MSRKSGKREKQETISKDEAGQKAAREGYGKVRAQLPINLQMRVEAENNPDAVIAEALLNYYGGKSLRNEAAVQKEIDNNIIEIQRRHISDLKEQLTATNKNYDELMKTHQAYMLQIQPLIEYAKLREAERNEISAPKDETKNEDVRHEKAEKEEAKSEDVKKEEAKDGEAKSADVKIEEMKNEDSKNNAPAEPEKEPDKTKKWYEFWK